MSEVTVAARPKSQPYDLLFVIGAPVLAFTAITLVSHPRSITGHFLYDPLTPEWFVIFTALLTHSHVMMVFVRSHMNPGVFRRFPFRFVALPLLTLVAFTVSPTLVAIMTIVAIYWDEWHSQMQTFGFGRIYDSRLGNDPLHGRRLDMGMIFILGLLPHALLLTYLPEEVRVQGLYTILGIGGDLAIEYGHYISYLRTPLIALAVAYTLYYLHAYRKLIKAGYKISPKKLALMGVTGTTAILVASFYSVADAAHFINIYHSLQYFFIVCVAELPLLSERVRKPWMSKKAMLILTSGVVLTLVFIAGVLRETNRISWLANFWLLSSLLHFWYDGFIWSVRRKDV